MRGAEEPGGGPGIFGGRDGRFEGDAGAAEHQRVDQEPASVGQTLLQRDDASHQDPTMWVKHFWS